MSVLCHYERKALVPFEEDEYHEFKGHRSLAIEELPPWCYHPQSTRRSRKAASRAIAAFFNSGRGGTVYLGIIDEGVVKGIYLTEFQKDHVLVSLKDLFSRYRPVVTEDKYEVTFVPVFGKDCPQNIIKPELNLETAQKHLKAHLLRTYDFCWCDQELGTRIDNDEKTQDYVVEIKIHPQKGTFQVFDDSSFKAVLPVVYENEEGKCFFRKSASCVEYTVEMVKELAREQIKDMYDPILQSLRQQVNDVKQLGVT